MSKKDKHEHFIARAIAGHFGNEVYDAIMAVRLNSQRRCQMTAVIKAAIKFGSMTDEEIVKKHHVARPVLGPLS